VLVVGTTLVVALAVDNTEDDVVGVTEVDVGATETDEELDIETDEELEVEVVVDEDGPLVRAT
jgi:hypothetical protein